VIQHIQIERMALLLAGDRLQNVLQFVGDDLDAFLLAGCHLKLPQQAMALAAGKHLHQRIHDPVDDPPSQRRPSRADEQVADVGARYRLVRVGAKRDDPERQRKGQQDQNAEDRFRQPIDGIEQPAEKALLRRTLLAMPMRWPRGGCPGNPRHWRSFTGMRLNDYWRIFAFIAANSSSLKMPL